MVSAEECVISQILYGSSWLLHNVHCRVLKDGSLHHFLEKEGEEISMDKRMWEKLPVTEAVVNQCSNPEDCKSNWRFFNVYICMQRRTGGSPQLEWVCNMLWVHTIEREWKALCNSQFGVGRHSEFSEEMEPIPHGKEVWTQDRPL